MFLELIATVFAGLAAGGVVMLVLRASGRRGLRWMVPVSAGLAMIAATISNEYSWYARTAGALPDGFVVADTVERKALYQPWTYVAPYVARFVAVDVAGLRSHDARPDEHLADLYFFGRWRAVERMSVLADCAGGRRAQVPEGADFDADGALVDAGWVAVGPEDPVMARICGGQG